MKKVQSLPLSITTKHHAISRPSPNYISTNMKSSGPEVLNNNSAVFSLTSVTTEWPVISRLCSEYNYSKFKISVSGYLNNDCAVSLPLIPLGCLPFQDYLLNTIDLKSSVSTYECVHWPCIPELDKKNWQLVSLVPSFCRNYLFWSCHRWCHQWGCMCRNARHLIC